MPVRLNPNRPKCFRARYRIQNWPQYEAGLKRRGDLTLWLDEAAIAEWQAPRRTTPGGQALYSDLAIELVLTLRLVFHLGLRQAEGFVTSVLRLLGLDLPVPDHTTLSRRGRTFANRRPRVVSDSPLRLLIDSTGLKLLGTGEWNREKHGRTRRSWRKLHLAVDAETGEIVAGVLIGHDAGDAGQVPVLLDQVEGEIATVMADGAYDGEPVYCAIKTRQPNKPPPAITSVTPMERIASATDRRCAVSTSTCRSLATISSAVCRFLDIDPSSTWHEAIPQEGPLLRGQTNPACRLAVSAVHPELP